MPAQLTAAYQDALEFAIQLHAGQSRKGTDIPYISHVLAVSATVLEFGGTEEEAIAALLHDAVEDAGGQATRTQIAERFGEAVAAIVDGCTDDSPALGEKGKPWRIRKVAHIHYLREAPAPVLLVTAADKLHDVRALASDIRFLGDSLWDRFTATRDDILWYYDAVVDALEAGYERILGRDADSAQLGSGLGRLIFELNAFVQNFNFNIRFVEIASESEGSWDDVLDFFGPFDLHEQLERSRDNNHRLFEPGTR